MGLRRVEDVVIAAGRLMRDDAAFAFSRSLLPTPAAAAGRLPCLKDVGAPCYVHPLLTLHSAHITL